VVDKFHWLAEPYADGALRQDIVAAVDNLEHLAVAELTALLARVDPAPRRPRTHHM
jgi:2-methylcitrate dehydratase